MKVLYIAAWGRSGTTIVDNILGGYDSVFSAGELFYLWRRGLVQGRRCGCNEMVRDCSIWHDVLDAAYDGAPPPPKQIAALQRRVVRVRDTRRLTRAEPDGEAAEYRDHMSRIYSAIGKVTGASLIVDSSKVPAGAAVLARIPDVESYLLHMVRDPRAVAYSWMRPKAQTDVKVPRQMKPHGTVESTTNWVTWNMLIEGVARGAYPERTLRLRYEDFVSAPRDRIESVLSFTGTRWTDGPFTDERTVVLGPNHTVSGNPSRFRTGAVALRADDAWRAEQAWRPRTVSTALALPLLYRYGYAVGGEPKPVDR